MAGEAVVSSEGRNEGMGGTESEYMKFMEEEKEGRHLTLGDNSDMAALESPAARTFMRSMFNPMNPFIAGAVSALGVVALQTAWMKHTYEPLPYPQEDKSSGYAKFNNSTGSELKRLLVLGDSLVLGVGCDKVPVLSESLARVLSRELKADVAWRSFGIDGGDCRTIHAAALRDAFLQGGVPGVHHPGDGSQEAAHRTAEVLFQGEPGAGGRRHGQYIKVDVCIVLCGLNDFKKLYLGRTASVFGKDLRNFVLDLRRALGWDCHIILPALPLEPTRFPEPLRSFVIFIGEQFDDEKSRLCHEHHSAHFIPKPASAWWRSVRKRRGGIISADGVHPNEAGYQVYGEFLGRQIARVMFRFSQTGAQQVLNV